MYSVPTSFFLFFCEIRSGFWGYCGS